MICKVKDNIQLKEDIRTDYGTGDLRHKVVPSGIYQIIEVDDENCGNDEESIHYLIAELFEDDPDNPDCSERPFDKFITRGWWYPDSFKQKLSKENDPEYFL